MAKEFKYKITNYGNTRSVYIDGQTWEVPRNGKVETTNKEVADAFRKLPFVDISRKKIRQPVVEAPEKKTPKKKKKVTTRNRKMTKRRKVKRRNKK